MRILFRFALVVLGVVVALALAEVTLRWMGPAVDPDAANTWLSCVGWAGRPHQEMTYYTDEFTTTEVINSAALPDVEHSYRKPGGVFRILVIGDSFVEAWHVELADSFPRLLEKLLNDNRPQGAPRFEVVKAGYRGWATDQELLYFRCEGYRYSPDLVLLAFTTNDVQDNHPALAAQEFGWPPGEARKPYFALEDGDLLLQNFPYPPVVEEAQPQSFADYLYKNLVAYRIAKKGWETASLKIEEAKNPPADAGPEITENRYPLHNWRLVMPLYDSWAPPEYEQSWELTAALLGQFNAEVQGKGARLAVVANAQMWAVHPEVRQKLIAGEPLYQGRDFDWDGPDRRLDGVLNDLGVPGLALKAGFDEYAARNPGSLLFFRDGHFNLAGHRLAAELIYRWLVEERLVPVR